MKKCGYRGSLSYCSDLDGTRMIRPYRQSALGLPRTNPAMLVTNPTSEGSWMPRRSESDLFKDRKKWPGAHKWMSGKMDAFDRVLRPLVEELDDSPVEDAEGSW